MDSSTDNDEQQPLKSPPRRRRSTFFVRRDSLISQQCENVDPNICVQRSEEETKQDDKLQRYYNQLTSEKEQWKKEVNERKHKYHDLRQQYRLMAQTANKSRISYAVLSNDDIDFLKGKHNITKLMESQSALHKSVSLTKVMYKKHVELENVLVNHVEEKLNKITDYILQNSTVDSVE